MVKTGEFQKKYNQVETTLSYSQGGYNYFTTICRVQSEGTPCDNGLAVSGNLNLNGKVPEKFSRPVTGSCLRCVTKRKIASFFSKTKSK